MLSRLHAYVIFVTDLDAAIDVYERVLGAAWRRETRTETQIEGELAGLPVRLVRGMKGDAMPWFEVDDIEAAQRALQQAGLTIVMGIHRIPPGRALRVADPYGNVIGLLER